MNPSLFQAKSGASVGGVSLEQYRAILEELQSTYLLSPLQISEAAGFSMAMVVRYALGLDAAGGQVMVLVRDCLSGTVAAAALRHLVNSGASGMIGLEMEPPETASPAYVAQLEALNALGVPIFLFPQVQRPELEGGIADSHNVIVGLYDERDNNSVEALWPVLDVLNESATPIHSIGSPLDLDVDSGKPFKNPLYASSTLSLGLPFTGHAIAKDLVGRHYVCDISIPRALREKHEIYSDYMFSEQPVLQIEPKADTPATA